MTQSNPKRASKPTSAPQEPGANLPPCERDQLIDPATCEVMPGHQHPVDDVDELADSIAVVGQLHPGQVFELPDGKRWIAAGRRRWLACRKRGYLYRADIWKCTESAARGEDLARVIRIVENDQRKDPSAYDLAVQLRRVRNENAYSSAREVAAHVGMSEIRAKRYLSIFQASDRLLETAQRESLPLKVVTELIRCEKQFGEARTRKYIQGVVAGELSAGDLARTRKVAVRGKRTMAARDHERALATAARRVLGLVAADRDASSTIALDLVARLRATYGDGPTERA